MDEPRRRTIAWDDPRLAAAEVGRRSGLDFLQAIARGELPAPPIAALVDMRLDHVEPGLVRFTATPAEMHYNPIGSVHGGIAATLLDSALGCSVHSTLPAGRGYTTLEIKITYIRAMTVATGPVIAEARVIHAGRQMAAAEGRIVDGAGRLYATGTTTCLVFDLPAAG